MEKDFCRTKTVDELCKEICSEIKFFESSAYEDGNNIKISNYEILARNKVIRVSFSDGSQEKVICDDKDKFDLRRGLFIALSKRCIKRNIP